MKGIKTFGATMMSVAKVSWRFYSYRYRK